MSAAPRKRLPFLRRRTRKPHTTPVPVSESTPQTQHELEHFGPEFAQNARAHQSQVDEDERRIGAPYPDSPRDQLKRLRSERRKYQRDYMRSLKRAGIFAPGFSSGKGPMYINDMQRVYLQMMRQAILRPLAQGVSVDSVGQSVGMTIGVLLASPVARNHVCGLSDQARKWVDDRREQHSEAVFSKKLAMLQKREERGETLDSYDPRDYMNPLQRRTYDAMQFRKRGYREPFTVETAAMTHLAIAENAFDSLRRYDADGQKVIETQYSELSGLIDRQCQEDGLDLKDVHGHMRKLLGHHMEIDPMLRAKFTGISHGFIRKSPDVHVHVRGEKEPRYMWQGTFETGRGEPIDEPPLKVRPHYDKDRHIDEMTHVATDMLDDAVTRGDREALVMTMAGYLAGYVTHGEGIETRSLPPRLRACIEQSQAMFASMQTDNFSPEASRDLFGQAYANALDATQERHPQFTTQLQEVFGKDWPAGLQHTLDRAEEVIRQAHEEGYHPGQRFQTEWISRYTQTENESEKNTQSEQTSHTSESHTSQPHEPDAVFDDPDVVVGESEPSV